MVEVQMGGELWVHLLIKETKRKHKQHCSIVYYRSFGSWVSVCFSSFHVGSCPRRSWTPLQHMSLAQLSFCIEHWDHSSTRMVVGPSIEPLLGRSAWVCPSHLELAVYCLLPEPWTRKLWHLLSQNPFFLSPLRLIKFSLFDLIF
jgi:hypothetical protein